MEKIDQKVIKVGMIVSVEDPLYGILTGKLLTKPGSALVPDEVLKVTGKKTSRHYQECVLISNPLDIGNPCKYKGQRAKTCLHRTLRLPTAHEKDIYYKHLK